MCFRLVPLGTLSCIKTPGPGPVKEWWSRRVRYCNIQALQHHPHHSLYLHISHRIHTNAIKRWRCDLIGTSASRIGISLILGWINRKKISGCEFWSFTAYKEETALVDKFILMRYFIQLMQRKTVTPWPWAGCQGDGAIKVLCYEEYIFVLWVEAADPQKLTLHSWKNWSHKAISDRQWWGRQSVLGKSEGLGISREYVHEWHCWTLWQ